MGFLASVDEIFGRMVYDVCDLIVKRRQRVRVCDLSFDPKFVEGIKDIVKTFSVIPVSLSEDESGYHGGLPFYIFQLKLKNERDRETVETILRKLVSDGLLRNGIVPGDVLIDFRDYKKFPAVEVRYACTEEQAEMIRRALDLEKGNLVDLAGMVRDGDLFDEEEEELPFY